MTLKDKNQEFPYRALVEGSIHGIFVHRDGKLLFVNRAFSDMLGYESPEELLALVDMLDVVAPEDRDLVRQKALEPKTGELDASRYQMRALHKDGGRLWLDILTNEVSWPGGPAVQVTAVDITERKQAEAALRASEAKYRNLVEGSIQGVIVHRNFRLLFANQSMAAMLGYDSPADILALGSALVWVHPDEHERLAEYRARRMAGADAPARYRIRALHRDGAEIWLENSSRIVEWEGEPAIQATFIDITDRENATEAMRESEARLKDAQRIAHLGGWDWYIDEGTLYWSDEIYRIFGVPPNAFQATYEAFLQRVHPDDRDAVERAIGRALTGEERYSIDHRIVLDGGVEKIVHEEGEVIRDEAGAPVRMSGAIQDVTELRMAEAEVRRLNADLEDRVERRTRELRAAQAELLHKQRLATLGQLTATVSHEIRNPLAGIRTSVFVLAKQAGMDDDRSRRAIDRIERGVARCDRIIDELLDFSRMRGIERETVAVDAWLGAVLDEQVVPDAIRLDRDFRMAGQEASLDPNRLRRAVINVLENAFHALADSKDDGRVTVATSLSEGWVEISISDNGPGMTADIRDKIFEPFFSTRTFGVGLGLPTVYQILEQHGGSAEVSSEPDAGTTFRLRFPGQAARDTGTAPD